jgi:hypothetical protein
MNTLHRHVNLMDIASLTQTPELQGRVGLNNDVVQEYAERMAEGCVFPPVLVFADGNGTAWLVDGYHRTAACERLGRDNVLAEVRTGTHDDALWASCSANKCHGLRRSNADKRRAVERALVHPRSVRLSDRQIGQYCGVHHHTVGRIRRELECEGSVQKVASREVIRGHTRYRQSITGIVDANARRRATVAGAKLANASVACDSLTPAVPSWAEYSHSVAQGGVVHSGRKSYPAQRKFQVTQVLAVPDSTEEVADLFAKAERAAAHARAEIGELADTSTVKRWHQRATELCGSIEMLLEDIRILRASVHSFGK